MAVNRLVAGSSPARGATWNKGVRSYFDLTPFFFRVWRGNYKFSDVEAVKNQVSTRRPSWQIGSGCARSGADPRVADSMLDDLTKDAAV
jgi:hypothetical protein